MTMAPHHTALADPQTALHGAHAALRELDTVILGKSGQVRLALCCLLAGGHLLLQDVPGVGKTTLAHALAGVLGLGFGRVQFTSDLLPGDLLGVNVFDRTSGEFRFQPGPIFAAVLLADELNRASPKTQSALLEAMEEEQVSVDGVTHPLPSPFFVIATANPQDQVGTSALPESQLDRFLMSLSLGYPDPAHERALLLSGGRRGRAQRLPAHLPAPALQAAQQGAAGVHVSEALVAYLQALLAASRAPGRFRSGLSPRAGLGLLAAARAWAWLGGRGFVVAEDVQAVFLAVAGHRLQPLEGGPAAAGALLRETAIP